MIASKTEKSETKNVGKPSKSKKSIYFNDIKSQETAAITKT